MINGNVTKRFQYPSNLIQGKCGLAYLAWVEKWEVEKKREGGSSEADTGRHELFFDTIIYSNILWVDLFPYIVRANYEQEISFQKCWVMVHYTTDNDSWPKMNM